MKKLLYISFVDYGDHNNLGVLKKIEGQKKAFASFGYEIDYLKVENNSYYFNEELITTLSGRWDYWFKLPLWLYNFFKKKTTTYDIIYIRRELLSPLSLLLFKLLKKRAKFVFWEIPTYPYRLEFANSFSGKAYSLIDRANVLFFKRDIDRIITTQNFDEIWGVKTIKIRNGYDFSSAPSITKNHNPILQFIVVSNFQYWHGLDRLINGMHNYNQAKLSAKREVDLNVIGSGSMLDSYKRMVVDLQLANVHFLGPKYGEALKSIYLKSDIGIGALGLYRRKSSFQSMLKNIEYCYYGLPFITGHPDDDLKGCEFVLEFPNDGSPIDIEKVINWYDKLSVNPKQIQESGQKLYDWRQQVEKIIRALD